ncbi:unnamed protein product [marine sediment metagenome]|uniref:Uncharacterized protein n=1 Tax=marine sediment metagenome TaxID=412755 RepID=X1A1Y5_9ZZZZ
MATITLSLEEYEALRDMAMNNHSRSEPIPIAAAKKKRRKVSKYSREFGRQLKALKKKHPRSKISGLMKRAHRLTKKKLK